MNVAQILMKSARSIEERVNSQLRGYQQKAEVEAQQLSRLRGMISGGARTPARSALMDGAFGTVIGALPGLALGRPNLMTSGALLGAGAGAAYGATAPARTRDKLQTYLHGNPMIVAPSSGPLVEKRVPPKYLKMVRRIDE